MSVRDRETPAASEFPLREAHSLVRDLMTPNPWIYWADFLFHILLGWIAFVSILSMPLFSLEQLPGLIVATLAFYRAAIFIHELAHLKKGYIQVVPSSVECHLWHTTIDPFLHL